MSHAETRESHSEAREKYKQQKYNESKKAVMEAIDRSTNKEALLFEVPLTKIPRFHLLYMLYELVKGTK